MNKLVLIFVILLAILVLGSMMLFSLFGTKKAPEQPPPIIQASFNPSPFKSSNLTTGTETLKLIATTPTEDTTQIYLPVKQVSFTFNQPLNLTTISAESLPSVKMVTTLKENDQNTIIISPQEGWQEGITTITIQTATSTNGSQLDKPVLYKIHTEYPKNPPPDAPGL